jgi:hypothetical protein
MDCSKGSEELSHPQLSAILGALNSARQSKNSHDPCNPNVQPVKQEGTRNKENQPPAVIDTSAREMGNGCHRTAGICESRLHVTELDILSEALALAEDLASCKPEFIKDTKVKLREILASQQFFLSRKFWDSFAQCGGYVFAATDALLPSPAWLLI